MTTEEGALQAATEHNDPFNGNSQVVTWGHPINLTQFVAELAAALPDVRIISYQPMENRGDVLNLGAAPVWADPSAEDPVVMYLSPSTVDLNAVQRLLVAHRPDPYFGLTDQQRLLVQVRDKLANGEVLTSEEMMIALQALLGNFGRS